MKAVKTALLNEFHTFPKVRDCVPRDHVSFSVLAICLLTWHSFVKLVRFYNKLLKCYVRKQYLAPHVSDLPKLVDVLFLLRAEKTWDEVPVRVISEHGFHLSVLQVRSKYCE